jgi:kinetochore protein Spc7/SPC105
VSFASKTEVREIPGRKSDKGKSGNPIPHDSLPVSGAPHQALTNENTYPGPSNSRRRSSARYSISHSEDMDLTSVAPSAFPPMDHSAIADEEFDYDDNSGMDMTEVIHGDLIRKRSLSMGTRLPLSQISYTTYQEPLQHSFEEDGSQADSEADQSQLIEYTMPLNGSFRTPAQHDETWLALRQVTHSGDTPIEPEPSSDDFESSNIVHAEDGMDLDDAVQRLMHARKSLPSIPSIPANESGDIIYGQPQDETFSSMEESFEDDGNRTINVSKVFGRLSTDGLRIGMESTMEETEAYGAIVGPANSTPPPPPSNEATEALENSASTVFKPPPASLLPDQPPVFSAPHQPHQITTAEQSSFSPKESVLPQMPTWRPSSPSKTNPTLQPRFSISSKPPIASSPRKRPLPDDDTVSRPSPFKKIAAGINRPASVNNGTSTQPSPKPLSPSKKAPFQVPGARDAVSRPLALRRPSGYLARRKSLGVGLGPREEAHPPARSSPKKKAGLGLGRASLGSGSSDARTRFDQTRGFKATETEPPPCEREATHQGLASPTRTRGSPSPAPLASTSIAPAQPPPVAVADISTLQAPEDAEDEDEDVMQQWRKGVEPTESDEVGFFHYLDGE